MKKLVFSKEKFIEVEGKERYESSECKYWVDLCDAKSPFECINKGFIILPEWCIEIDDDKPKAKKVFSRKKFFEWAEKRNIDSPRIAMSLMSFVPHCIGKTPEECEPYKVLDDWLVEVDE